MGQPNSRGSSLMTIKELQRNLKKYVWGDEPERKSAKRWLVENNVSLDALEVSIESLINRFSVETVKK